jgi:nitrogen regulatory protein P-II 1
MREIKAYIQRTCVNRAVNALNEAGAPGITVVEVHPVGYGYEPNYFEVDFEKNVLKRYNYLEIVKLELVCSDTDLERLLDTIQHVCRTGAKGDGWIFVSEVTDAIRIRDGKRDALSAVR